MLDSKFWKNYFKVYDVLKKRVDPILTLFFFLYLQIFAFFIK